MHDCQACPRATLGERPVSGEGPAGARVMLVVDQPEDADAAAGRLLTGPAGRLLDEVLGGAGLTRATLYVTGAVKHAASGRAHARPEREAASACRAWLDAELAAVRPRFVLALGAAAAEAFQGPGFRLALERGRVREAALAPWWMATWHPTALLRAPDAASRERLRAELGQDVRALADAVARAG